MTISLLQHAAALALVLADILARAIRTRLLLPMPLSRIVTVNTCGDAVAAVTPARVGGDPVRYLGYVRAGAPAAGVLATFGLEIVADAVAMVGVGLVLALLFPGAGREILSSALALLRAPHAALVLGAVALALAASAAAASWLLPRTAARLRMELGEAGRYARGRSARVLALVTGWTVVSLIARGAILPVLLAGTPGLTPGAAILGSALLVYGQTLAPTPAGAGVVEIGFLVGFQRLLGSALPTLILVWRAYTLALGVVAGAVLLVREGLPRGWASLGR